MMSPASAAALLEMFEARKLELTEAQYDQLVDTVVSLLEKVNDQKFRLIKEEK